MIIKFLQLLSIVKVLGSSRP